MKSTLGKLFRLESIRLTFFFEEVEVIYIVANGDSRDAMNTSSLNINAFLASPFSTITKLLSH